MHSTSAEGPFVHGDDRFNVIFDMDVTNKESGERVQMREVATYVVNDGKIVREEFAYRLARPLAVPASDLARGHCYGIF